MSVWLSLQGGGVGGSGARIGSGTGKARSIQ